MDDTLDVVEARLDVVAHLAVRPGPQMRRAEGAR